MKNQYVGDIGDYGKYGLLRFLASRGVKIGINWYLTENDGSRDGRFTEYLNKPSFRKYDPELYDALVSIAEKTEKSVKMIEEAGLIPGADYYQEVLDLNSQEAFARAINRRLWYNNSFLLLGDAELIFADPDNGMTIRKKPNAKDSEKYVLPEEIKRYYFAGKNVVYYCHKGRRTSEAWEEAKSEIKNYIQDAQIIVETFHKGTQRSYVFVLHPDDYLKYRQMLDDFEKTAWGELFSRDDAGEKTISTKELKPIALETITYKYNDGFMVDIVKAVTDGIGDRWDIWLYHVDYGYKVYLFGIPMNTEPPASMQMVLEQIADNLKTETYIADYRKAYME